MIEKDSATFKANYGVVSGREPKKSQTLRKGEAPRGKDDMEGRRTVEREIDRVDLPSNSASLTDAFSSLRCACGAAKRER